MRKKHFCKQQYIATPTKSVNACTNPLPWHKQFIKYRILHAHMYLHCKVNGTQYFMDRALMGSAPRVIILHVFISDFSGLLFTVLDKTVLELFYWYTMRWYGRTTHFILLFLNVTKLKWFS